MVRWGVGLRTGMAVRYELTGGRNEIAEVVCAEDVSPLTVGSGRELPRFELVWGHELQEEAHAGGNVEAGHLDVAQSRSSD